MMEETIHDDIWSQSKKTFDRSHQVTKIKDYLVSLTTGYENYTLSVALQEAKEQVMYHFATISGTFENIQQYLLNITMTENGEQMSPADSRSSPFLQSIQESMIWPQTTPRLPNTRKFYFSKIMQERFQQCRLYLHGLQQSIADYISIDTTTLSWIQLVMIFIIGLFLIWILLSFRKRKKRRRQSLRRLQRKSEINYGGRSLTFAPTGTVLQDNDQQQEHNIEVFRSGRRGRFSTFDFFGMNYASGSNNSSHHRRRNLSTGSYSDPNLVDFALPTTSQHHPQQEQQRGRSNTATSITGNANIKDNRNFKRERLGSMDVYYAGGGMISPPQRKNTNRTTSDETPRSYGGFQLPTEPHMSSPAVIDEGGRERYLYDEFGIVTLSHRVEYYGPKRLTFDYSTFTPPTSWTEASRRIIPTVIMTRLERKLRLDVFHGTLEVTEPTSGGQYDFSLPVDILSIYVQRPLEGGVINLYVKDTPKEEWMEHTFDTAHAAAQFQLDLLSYQMLGKTITHIFEALNLIHQGSIAFSGQEFVLHDDVRDSNNNKSKEGPGPPESMYATQCVAWDDAMRSMSSIPTVRIALERLWLSHRHPSNIGQTYNTKQKKAKIAPEKEDKAEESEKEADLDLSLLTDEYSGKRLLLGPLDFFRLFVPALPDASIPEGESNRGRMEQFMGWRKRVARAAVLVRSYTRARCVANLGWHLKNPTTGDVPDTVSKRLAFDGNEDNNVRDTAAKNEIYESSVSRDVLCYVRPFDFLSEENDGNNDGLVLSPYQAYSHVGSQYFKATPKMLREGGSLHPSRDPVDMFPSLKRIIAENSDLDFFVKAASLIDSKVVVIHLYVRSLAKGVDPHFDNVMDRFVNGNVELRERKLHLMYQLGNRMGLSYSGWLFLRLLSFIFQLTDTGRDSPINLESTRDRYAFPAFKVSSFFKTYHFGGALQIDPTLPKNYVAVNQSVTTKHMVNIIPRMLFKRLQGHLSDSIVDLTYFIEGNKEDELPERALSTLRQVHVDPVKVGRDPRKYLSAPATRYGKNGGQGPFAPADHEKRSTLRELYQSSVSSFQSMAAIVSSPLRGSQESAKQTMNAITEEISNDLEEDLGRFQIHGDALDPEERAVNAVIEVLDTVTVPSRVSPDDAEADETGLLVMTNLPILTIFNRNDVVRFVRASDYEIKETAVRLVQSAAWRGRTFPLDKRRFRIELQNGQFFQQGFDNDNNPVYYFCNMCRGPWRGNEDAVVSAVLYRLEKSLAKFCMQNPYTKITLIILMGRPVDGANDSKKRKNSGTDTDAGTVNGDLENHSDLKKHGAGGDNAKENETKDATTRSAFGDNNDLNKTVKDMNNSRIKNNPRISEDEKWKCHSSKAMLEKLFAILRTHYPSRLANALIVKGRGNNPYYSTNLDAKMKLKKVLSGGLSSSIPDNIRFIGTTSELTKYVPLEELVSMVGGTAAIAESAYEF